MATQTQRRSPGSASAASTLEGGLERLVEPALFLVAGTLGVALVLPLAFVALPVFGALYALRTRRPALRGTAVAVCVLPALAALLSASTAQGAGPAAVVSGYVDLQLGAGEALLTGWPAVDWGAFGLAYALAVWPYAGAGGALAGALAFCFVSCGGGFSRGEQTRRNELRFQDAGELAAEAERPVEWVVPNAVGRGVLSLLSAPPGLGKGWWTWGMLRAMQDGGAFYGLRVRRPVRVSRFGRRVRPLKVLWCTEEGESFKRTARRFGIEPGLVEVVRRDRVHGWDWPELVRRVRREAGRRGCAVVIFDTVRAWCPQAEKSPEEANEVMYVARRELTEPGLGVLFVHHDRKGGGAFGEGVSGTYGLVGAVDVLIELRRVSTDPADPRRRMVTSRRFEPMDVTARLVGHRFVADGEPATTDRVDQDGNVGQHGAGGAPRPPVDLGAYRRYLRSEAWAERRARILARAGGRCERCTGVPPAGALEVHHLTYDRLGAEPPDDLIALCAPCHRGTHPPGREDLHPTVRRTLAHLERPGPDGALDTDALLAREGGSKKALLARLRTLEAAGLVTHRGRGIRGDPQRWRALP